MLKGDNGRGRELNVWRKFIQGLQLSRQGLRQMWLFRFFGDTLFHPDIWIFRPQLLAKGAALGLFIACTPTFGIQMLISAAMAILLRVNLPISLAATWITNVATAPFFYYSCYRVGLFLFRGKIPASEVAPFVGKWQTFAKIAYPLWMGSLIVGTVIALAGYFTIYYLCLLERRYRLKEVLQIRFKERLGKGRRLLKETKERVQSQQF